MEFPMLPPPLPVPCPNLQEVENALSSRSNKIQTRHFFSSSYQGYLEFGIYQSLYDEIEDVEFYEEFPSNYKDMLRKSTLAIIDYLMRECSNDK